MRGHCVCVVVCILLGTMAHVSAQSSSRTGENPNCSGSSSNDCNNVNLWASRGSLITAGMGGIFLVILLMTTLKVYRMWLARRTRCIQKMLCALIYMWCEKAVCFRSMQHKYHICFTLGWSQQSCASIVFWVQPRFFKLRTWGPFQSPILVFTFICLCHDKAHTWCGIIHIHCLSNWCSYKLAGITPPWNSWKCASRHGLSYRIPR